MSVVTTGPTYRLQLTLERAGDEVEAEMARIRCNALGLAPGTSVTLRPLEFGLFPTIGADPGAPKPIAATRAARTPQVAAT